MEKSEQNKLEVIGASITLCIPLEKLKKLEFMAEYENIPIGDLVGGLIFSSLDVLHEHYIKEGFIQ